MHLLACTNLTAALLRIGSFCGHHDSIRHPMFSRQRFRFEKVGTIIYLLYSIRITPERLDCTKGKNNSASDANIEPGPRMSKTFGRYFLIEVLHLTVFIRDPAFERRRTPSQPRGGELMATMWRLFGLSSFSTNYLVPYLPPFLSSLGISNCRMTFSCSHARIASAECIDPTRRAALARALSWIGQCY